MKRRIKEYQDEFALLFRDLVEKHGLIYVGCEAIEMNEQGNPINNKKNYSMEYIKLMKNLEQDLLNKKSDMVKEQNMMYYQKKCQELIDKSDTDSYCRAAANLMLNSDCQYLGDLVAKYKDKLGGKELRLSDQSMDIDEQKVQDIIDNIKNQSMRPRAVSDELQNVEEIKSNKNNITPHQDQKMFDEVRMRGLETSEMTCVYDKENIQINKPKKKP